MPRAHVLSLIFLLTIAPLPAQTAGISGFITDPLGLPVPGAAVELRNPVTGIARLVASNRQGLYGVPALPPGSYGITVLATGFKTLHQGEIILEVDQRASLDLTLSVGSIRETITIEGDTPLLNNSDASVSSVIDNRFVQNMPLNGRSFSSLIDLAPGVTIAATSVYDQGQFSVNGQRPDANYFTVDGASANLGNAGSGGLLYQGGAGQLPATNAFGGMSNLVSLDALQEFRVQTSTFAPEYGHMPGAQISVVTRAGNNGFHGSAFEYFRNDKLDANDWFANSKGLARPELRQNDFGGVLGAPIRKDKLFFFGSWEALRVRQPHVAETYVPSLATRERAPAAVQPLLNAFPLPNGPDLGNGTAAFSAGYSDPSTLDSSSVRIDYLPAQRVTIFGRYSDAPSEIQVRGGASSYMYGDVQQTRYGTHALTLGSNQTLRSRLTNELRVNYSRVTSRSRYILDHFGGATPPPDSLLYPSFASPDDALFLFFADATPYGIRFNTGNLGNNWQWQVNATDNLSWLLGGHQMKFGVDYRRINTRTGLSAYGLQAAFLSLANVLTNALPQAVVLARNDNVQLAFPSTSLFAQDTWKATRALTLTWGVRWEYNGAPSSPNGTLPFTVDQVNDFETMTVAPRDTPLWHPQKRAFAPRLGLAWQARPNLVFRAGAGIFYDLGYSAVANGAGAWPYGQQKILTDVSFPLSAANAAPPVFSTTPPVSYLAVVDPNHVLPRTYEWNAAVEKSFGTAEVVTVTYVGAEGRKLMRQDFYFAPNASFSGEFDLMRNGASSDYNALEGQFQHRLAHGLQALTSYTWAHSIDNVSSDAYYANVPPGASSDRGSSTWDIRQTFSGAVSYDIPAPGQGIRRSIFGSWSTDAIVYSRTAPPVNVVTGQNTFGTFLSGAAAVQRPNPVAGSPVWTPDPNIAGGRQLNRAAFSVPIGPIQGNLGRNTLRGFGAGELDLTVRRQFRLYKELSLQARADFFNVFNHPNFGSPVNYMSSPLFGQATQMLGASLGGGGQAGGLNPLYQIGGPRSVQLALKLIF